MRRVALLGWWLVSLAVWVALGHLLAGLLLHISWDVPLWLQHATEWGLRTIEHNPDYYPDAYDVEGALSLLIFISAYLLATSIIIPVSITAWRRMHRH